jgi:hypothetical protein
MTNPNWGKALPKITNVEGVERQIARIRCYGLTALHAALIYGEGRND